MINEKKLVALLDQYNPIYAVVSLNNGIRVASDSKLPLEQADEVAAYAQYFLVGKKDSNVLSFYSELNYGQRTKKIGADFLLVVLYSPSDSDLLKTSDELEPQIFDCLYEASEPIMPKEPKKEKRKKVPGWESYFPD